MFKDLVKKEYLLILIISFIINLVFNNIFNSIIISLLITLSLYLYNKYLSNKLNIYLNKLISWIKTKIK
jgi:hypothetical protein